MMISPCVSLVVRVSAGAQWPRLFFEIEKARSAPLSIEGSHSGAVEIASQCMSHKNRRQSGCRKIPAFPDYFTASPTHL
jgi:hypothetical protein